MWSIHVRSSTATWSSVPGDTGWVVLYRLLRDLGDERCTALPGVARQSELSSCADDASAGRLVVQVVLDLLPEVLDPVKHDDVYTVLK